MVEVSEIDIESAAAMTVTREKRVNLDPAIVERMKALVTDARFSTAAAAYIDELSRVGDEGKQRAWDKFVSGLQESVLPDDVIDNASLISSGVSAIRSAMARERTPPRP